MAQPKKETCEECACFLPYFVVAQERGIPENIISDSTNPNKYKMFCAKNFRETKKENPICSEFLKREGSGLAWQKLDEQKEKREEKKLKNRTLLISIFALIISIISLVIGILSHFNLF